MATKIEVLRRKVEKMPGTHAEKAQKLGTSVSWVTKFVAGDIQHPRSDRYEKLQRFFR